MFTTNLTLNDLIYPSADAEKAINRAIKHNGDFPDRGTNGIILYGPVGTGKTTCAYLLPAALEQARCGKELHSVKREYLSPTYNGVDLIAKIKNECAYYSRNASDLHYIMLDEVDNLTPDAMKALKTVMNIPKTVFIMTTNSLHRIHETVRDRSIKISFQPSGPAVWLPLARKELIANGLENQEKISDDTLLQIIQGVSPRGLIRELKDFAHEIKEELVQQASGKTS
jgi:DNA polymerase III delta prime subunit